MRPVDDGASGGTDFSSGRLWSRNLNLEKKVTIAAKKVKKNNVVALITYIYLHNTIADFT